MPWPLVESRFQRTVRPLHLLKSLAEVLYRYISAIRAISLILVLHSTHLAKAMKAEWCNGFGKPQSYPSDRPESICNRSGLWIVHVSDLVITTVGMPKHHRYLGAVMGPQNCIPRYLRER
jgi:hypothetical protein